MVKKKTKVDFYMHSGNVISLAFEEFTAHKNDNGTIKSMEWKNPSRSFSIDIKRIEAIIID